MAAGHMLVRIGFTLLPGHCVLCDLPSHRPVDLCAACEPLLEAVPTPCARCGLPAAAGCRCRHWPVSRTLAPLRYGGATAQLLNAFKQRADLAAGTVLYAQLHRALARQPDAAALAAAAAVVPVPQSLPRTLKRRFDPVAWLAARIARSLDVPLARGWLHRRAGRPPQRGLDRRLRIGNLQGAYRLTRRGRRALAAAPSRPLLLVDDVVTTGATLTAIAAALARPDAPPPVALALARTLPEPTDAEAWPS